MGVHLILFNHKTRKSYDLGKILGGGSVDYKLSNYISFEEISEQMFIDYRDQVLVENIDQPIELVKSNSQRHGDLLSMKFRHFTVADVLFHRDGTTY